MTKKKILVVDDEVMLVDFLKMRLENAGYEVETASDGTEGLLKLAQSRPDLIVLDIYMEPMDGLSMLKKVREDEKVKDIPIIMLTASGKKREVFEAEGISDYITKPFDSKDFLTRVGRVLKDN